MTLTEKLALMKNREIKLASCPKDIKCPGALRKLRRQIRNMSKLV